MGLMLEALRWIADARNWRHGRESDGIVGAVGESKSRTGGLITFPGLHDHRRLTIAETGLR